MSNEKRQAQAKARQVEFSGLKLVECYGYFVVVSKR
jgi:hypothetical protein